MLLMHLVSNVIFGAVDLSNFLSTPLISAYLTNFSSNSILSQACLTYLLGYGNY